VSNQLDGFAPIGSFSYYDVTGYTFNKSADASPDKRMIIRNQNTYRSLIYDPLPFWDYQNWQVQRENRVLRRADNLTVLE
jgi:hypothetical protein